VQYAGHVAKIDIETLALIEGELPARAKGPRSVFRSFGGTVFRTE
jgi:hypothetical protein